MTLLQSLVSFADRLPFVDGGVEQQTMERNIDWCLFEPLFNRGPPGIVAGKERIDEFGKVQRRTTPIGGESNRHAEEQNQKHSHRASPSNYDKRMEREFVNFIRAAVVSSGLTFTQDIRLSRSPCSQCIILNAPIWQRLNSIP